MAENEPQTPETWKSPQLRQGIQMKIQETINAYGVSTNKSPVELERSVYQKAASKEQYLSFVARLIIHLKNNGRPGMGPPGQGGPGQGLGLQGTHQQLVAMMNSGTTGLQQQQQQQMQQQMHPNQLNALQQQTLQQLKSELGQVQGMSMPQQQQQQMMQQSNLNNGLGAMGGIVNNSGGPNKMMLNAGNAGHPMSNDQQMANMIALQKAKHQHQQQQQQQQMNSQMGVNSALGNTNQLNLVNSNSFNPNSMNLGNANVNNVNSANLVNLNANQLNSLGGGNSGAGGIANVQGSSATTITSILNSNMKPKLVTPNMMTGGGPGGRAMNVGGGGGHAMNMPQNAAQQLAAQNAASVSSGGGQTLSLQQQLAQQQHHQQQHTRMMQPNSANLGGAAGGGGGGGSVGALGASNAGGLIPNTRMMMSQSGIRQQNPNQMNIAPNLQTQLRLRQMAPGGLNSLQQQQQMNTLHQQQQQHQQGQPGGINIYIQQQQQQHQQAQHQSGMNVQNAETKFFEINNNLNQSGVNRITPVTVSQVSQLRPGLVSNASNMGGGGMSVANFGQQNNFNNNANSNNIGLNSLSSANPQIVVTGAPLNGGAQNALGSSLAQVANSVGLMPPVLIGSGSAGPQQSGSALGNSLQSNKISTSGVNIGPGGNLGGGSLQGSGPGPGGAQGGSLQHSLNNTGNNSSNSMIGGNNSANSKQQQQVLAAMQQPHHSPATMMSAGGINNLQNSVHHSPSNFHANINSPASVQSIPMMSPAGRAAISSAPSPQSTLNTPASPGQAATPTSQAKVAELAKLEAERLYNEKLTSMQKYLTPLMDLMQHLEKDERKTKELDRLKNLYAILVNQRRVALDFLEKCENALEKMDRDQMFINKMRNNRAGGHHVGPGGGLMEVSPLGTLSNSMSQAAALPQSLPPPQLPHPQQSQQQQQQMHHQHAHAHQQQQQQQLHHHHQHHHQHQATHPPSLSLVSAGVGGATAAAGLTTSGAAASSATGTTTTTTASTSGGSATHRVQELCNRLLSAVEKNFDKPMFSHTMGRTFGPTLSVLHHESYSTRNRVNVSASYLYYSNSDPRKRKARETLPFYTIRNQVLEGEIARLDARFVVRPLMASKRFCGTAKTHLLLCRLEDLDLPCVPPIKVYISDTYPATAPFYDMQREDYQATPFFLKLYDHFRANLQHMTGTYTLTELLLTWERSIRQAILRFREKGKGEMGESKSVVVTPSTTETNHNKENHMGSKTMSISSSSVSAIINTAGSKTAKVVRTAHN